MRSLYDPGAPGEFGRLLRDDVVLRDAFIGNTEGAVGALDHARSDDPNIPTTSAVGPYGPNPAVMELALWKTIGVAGGLYSYFYSVFSKTLRSGAAGDGYDATDPTLQTVHSGIVRLALDVLRNAVQNTSTIADVMAKASSAFIGGTWSAPPTNEAIVKLSDALGSDPRQNAANGLPFGASDLDYVMWNRLSSELGGNDAVATALGESYNQVFGNSQASTPG